MSSLLHRASSTAPPQIAAPFLLARPTFDRPHSYRENYYRRFEYQRG
jgi:hypothetical protein